MTLSQHPDEERDVAPVFLTIGSTRVYCVGCKSWQPTEGYCEGDPDICPIGEEDQGRSPTLAEAQEAIDKLASELTALDEHSAGVLIEQDATIATLRAQLTEAQADRERLDWLDATCAGITHVPLCSNYPAFWAVDPNEDASEYLGEGFTIREALDAARLASSSESGKPRLDMENLDV